MLDELCEELFEEDDIDSDDFEKDLDGMDVELSEVDDDECDVEEKQELLDDEELELLIFDPTLAMNGKSNATFGHPAVAPSHPFTSRKSYVQRSCM